MKIAQIAPVVERIPPKKYGGVERVISALTEELVKMGHDVTLFATGDSQTSAKLVSVYPKALRDAKISDIYGANQYTILNLANAYTRQADFDIIHDHTGYFGLPSASIAQTPVVHTLHGQITAENRRMFEQIPNVHYVAISQAQLKPVPNLPVAGIVYNGLPMEHYPFSDNHDGYLLYVGRLTPEKAPHYAIKVAQYLNQPLIIAAKLDTAVKSDVQYFKQYIEPFLDGDLVKWVGEVDEEERNKLMANAKCMLHTAIWREPFGLTIIEAMACGCPVVAFARGSMRELISQGRTGFLVEDADEMIEAVSNIDLINRQECRRHALESFNAVRMAKGYEEIYTHVLDERKHGQPVGTTTAKGLGIASDTQQFVQAARHR